MRSNPFFGFLLDVARGDDDDRGDYDDSGVVLSSPEVTTTGTHERTGRGAPLGLQLNRTTHRPQKY